MSKGHSLAALVVSGRSATVDEAVLAQVKALGPVCRDAVAKASDLLVSTTCGAIDRLQKRGLIKESEQKVYNAITRRTVKAYEAVEEV